MKNRKYYELDDISGETSVDSDKGDKLPLKSISGKRCLTKCYAKGTTYLHPILLTGVSEKTNDTCAVEPAHDREPKHDYEHSMIFSDKCKLEDNFKNKLPDEMESILLSFYFNARDFLTGIYDLHSFNQVIFWTLDNDHLPFHTIKRVHNCAWKVFGNDINELSSDVLEYYFDISKDHWLKNYSRIIRNEYSFEFTSDKPLYEISSGLQETYEILYSNFYTYGFFVNAIKKYVYEYQDKWDLIESHYNRIKKYIFNQLIRHIENESNK